LLRGQNVTVEGKVEEPHTHKLKRLVLLSRVPCM